MSKQESWKKLVSESLTWGKPYKILDKFKSLVFSLLIMTDGETSTNNTEKIELICNRHFSKTH